MKTVFLRVLEELHDKAAALQARDRCRRVRAWSSAFRAYAEASAFSSVPGSPFAYWVSEDISALFSKYEAFEKP